MAVDPVVVNPLKTAAYMETPAHRPWARSERTVGRREASTPGPVVPVTADMVAADVTSHFCKDDLKRLSFSGKQEDADSWQFVLKTTVKHVLGLHAEQLIDMDRALFDGVAEVFGECPQGVVGDRFEDRLRLWGDIFVVFGDAKEVCGPKFIDV